MTQDAPPRRPARVLTVVVVIVGALAVLGSSPSGPAATRPTWARNPTTTSTPPSPASTPSTCHDPETDAPGECQLVSAGLTSGADDGDEIDFEVRATQFDVPELAEGDDVVLLDVATSPPEFRYSFADFQRCIPLLWLVGAVRRGGDRCSGGGRASGR